MLTFSSKIPLQVLTGRAAAPLSLMDVHIWVHKDVLCSGGGGNRIPDLETSGVLGPAGVLLNDLLGDLSSVDVAQGVDHGDFERNVHSLTIVHLINHLDRVGPAFE
jgi:hypothetical protein